ncbi:HNH endonuclease [Glaciecola petra]|uniref:HNH endonuclease signature motif containing protein n=1 Tax=Glaciecola petra TaxID=3075602 RepID=A0ABU2ZPM6_9ALTE|nr:HNH endonuclease signature motif containing protein [Aestuariibacter sp. P117]MDT0594550.1 HNH endonuclease signature motif containing protein [Aestuariibacter sp. P117]
MEVKRCAFTGCPLRVDVSIGKYCANHNQRPKDKRLPAHYKGYDHTWRRYRKRYLRANPLCVRCKDYDIINLATVVDHIEPVNGANDPLFYVEDNHQPLCRDCHAWKTRVIDKRGFGAVRGGSAT